MFVRHTEAELAVRGAVEYNFPRAVDLRMARGDRRIPFINRLNGNGRNGLAHLQAERGPGQI